MTTVVDFTIPLEFGMKREMAVNKAFTYDVRWKAINREQFLDLKVRDLVDTKGRFVIEGRVNGQVFRIVSNDDDYTQVRLKYPKDLAIHLSQIAQIFAKTSDIETELPRILLPLSVLGAKVSNRR